MYVDRDNSNIASIMKITEAELRDIGCILFEFESSQANLPEREKARLNLLAAKIRFMIVDEMKKLP